MLRNQQQLPPPPRVPPKPRKEPNVKHWSQKIHETVVSALPEESLNIVIKGGADTGFFCYIGNVPKHDQISYHSGSLHPDDIILEIQGRKVSGYTYRDINIWLKQVSQNGAPVMVKTVRPGPLPKDLRQFLTSRFQKGSIDHDLQQTIRDNLYMRTVPCTTRPPRPGEINGVDYVFLNLEEFMELEKGGSLLESGIFDGNHYGTPKPPKEPTGVVRRANSAAATILSGAHPSSEGKRKRNRSNTEAVQSRSSPISQSDEKQTPSARKKSLEHAHSSADLGPLPTNWEIAYNSEGIPYFIDHDTETTHWLDPRLSKLKKDAKQCSSEELPYGWEKVEDPHYGTYYIDHMNRRTQYENPVAQAKKEPKNSETDSSTLPRNNKITESAKRSVSDSNMNSHKIIPTSKRVFTKNPAELKGAILKTILVKSPRGFGFTIIGGDRSDEEFLQIKNVVPNGPAYQDGKLRTGDILIHVNDLCVLGYTHQDVVKLFQTISPGQTVTLEICRGYPLPFDPDDPNTEIITTIAVSLPQFESPNNPAGQFNPTDMNRSTVSEKSMKSLPDLTKSSTVHGNAKLQGKNEQLNNNNDNTPDVLNSFSAHSKPETLSINIVRGEMGFGFTIADSAYGQKVKQILDKPRCKNLQESDLLQEINSICVRDMSHTQVVQVLKECPRGQESSIVVQRGVIPVKSKKQPKLPSKPLDIGSPLNPSVNPGIACIQPGAYFFSGVGDVSSQSNVPGSSDLNDGQSDLSNRQRQSDTTDGGRPKTPALAEKRPKTPTRTQDTVIDNKNKPSSSNRAPLSEVHNQIPPDANVPRKEYVPKDDNSHDYNNHSRTDIYNNSGSHDYNSRPPPGPQRFDKFRPDIGQRSDFRYRNDYRQDNAYPRSNTMHNYYDRDPRYDYGRGEAKPGQFRSRTPGPELMNRSHGPDYKVDLLSRPKTPTALDMRSKTPVPGSTFGQMPGGNPDFAPGSRHQNSYGYNGAVRQPYGDRSWNSIPEHNMSPNIARRNDAMFERSYSGNPLHPQGSPRTSGRHSRQSTSFETDVPTPSKLTHVPLRPLHLNPSLGSQSPRPPRSSESNESICYVEMTVTLQRQDNGFGFRIIGGTEEGSQVSVGHIVPGGSADLDARLRTGDEIIYVDGTCVVSSSHHRVVQLMGESSTRGQVTLGIRRRMLQAADPYRGTVGMGEGYPFDVTVTRKEDEGFGFVIISSMTKSGSTIGEFIGRILENSPAERCDRLQIGDRILAVNGIDIATIHHEDIVNLIKDSGYAVTLTIGPPQDDASSAASTSQRSSQGSMVNAMAYPTHGENDISRRGDVSPFHYQNDRYFPPPPPPERLKEFNRGHHYPAYTVPEEGDLYQVELNRGSRGFGFSIRGGQEFNSMPLYVLRIAEGGAADRDGRLRVGDQLLEINNFNTENMSHTDAIDVIQNGGNIVRMLVQRTGKLPPSFDAPPPVPGRYPSMQNGPIGQSSPYLGRRTFERDENFYSNQAGVRSYPNY